MGRRPETENGFTDDVLLGKKAPNVRVVAVVAVVAHDKDISFWYF